MAEMRDQPDPAAAHRVTVAPILRELREVHSAKAAKPSQGYLVAIPTQGPHKGQCLGISFLSVAHKASWIS